MYDTDSDHLTVYARESAALEPDDWERWISEVSNLLGHSPDGNHATDGYSMDSFYNMWRRGVSAADAATAHHRPICRDDAWKGG